MNKNGKFLSVILRSLVIALAASAVGIVFNAFSPAGIHIRPESPVKLSETAIDSQEQPKSEPVKEISPEKPRPDGSKSQPAAKAAAQPDGKPASQPAKTVTVPATETVKEPAATGISPEAAPGAKPEVKTEEKPAAIKADIDLRRTKELFDAGNAIFLDARPEYEFLDGHITGARSLSESRFDFQYDQLKNTLRMNDIIVVYCEGGDCNLSETVAEKLSKLGYSTVYVFTGGWEAWTQAGYPTERTRNR